MKIRINRNGYLKVGVVYVGRVFRDYYRTEGWLGELFGTEETIWARTKKSFRRMAELSLQRALETHRVLYLGELLLELGHNLDLRRPDDLQMLERRILRGLRMGGFYKWFLLRPDCTWADVMPEIRDATVAEWMTLLGPKTPAEDCLFDLPEPEEIA
jgi:hypothetical protein